MMFKNLLKEHKRILHENTNMRIFIIYVLLLNKFIFIRATTLVLQVICSQNFENYVII